VVMKKSNKLATTHDNIALSFDENSDENSNDGASGAISNFCELYFIIYLKFKV